MTARVSSRDRRVLMIGVATCLTLVAGTRGVPALVSWTRAARENAAQLRAEVARASSGVASGDATRDSAAARNARYLALAPRLLAGETTAGAGGSLASLVTGAAAEANVRLGSVQIRADTAQGGTFTAVTLRADLTGDISGLTSMLAALERGQTLLAVRELSITQPEPAAGDDRPEVLRADILVESLMVTPRRGPSR